VLGLTSGSAFALFAWRAPLLKDTSVFAPISRESALVINNIILAAVTSTVLVGTVWPLILEAFGRQGGVGAPYYNLVVGPLMAVAFIVLPAGPLLAWKRGDARGALQRLTTAAAVAVAAALLLYALSSPKKAMAAVGVAFGVWLIAGALTEVMGRLRIARAPLAESARRLGVLPRGAWGMTLAHIGLGLFVMGAAYESAWRIESAQVLAAGDSMGLGAYHLRLDQVAVVPGANYDAQQAEITVTDASGRVMCMARPARRTYDVGGETTSKVALCLRGLDDVYVVIGERRTAGSQSTWLVRGFLNPWIRLLFLGPLLMAIGGALSLSDRRLRIAVGRSRAPAPTRLAAAE